MRAPTLTSAKRTSRQSEANQSAAQRLSLAGTKCEVLIDLVGPEGFEPPTKGL